MAKLSHIPEGMNSGLVLPNLGQIASDSQFPAYLRMAAMDIASERYSTVGSILSNMCPQDLGSILNSWMGQVSNAAQDVEDDGAIIMRVSNPAVFSYMLFTVMVAKAEAGEARFDPVTAGFQAELLGTFLRSIVIANQFERVTVDLTRFTLNWDFLDQDFNHVISTENFKAKRYVSEVQQIWKKMQKSETLAAVRGPKEPKKEELIAASSRFRARKPKVSKTLTSLKDLGQGLAGGKLGGDGSVSDFGDHLERPSGG